MLSGCVLDDQMMTAATLLSQKQENKQKNNYNLVKGWIITILDTIISDYTSFHEIKNGAEDTGNLRRWAIFK